MFFAMKSKMEMVTPQNALPGRAEPLPTAETHFLSGIPLKSPVPAGMAEAMFGMGVFLGGRAEVLPDPRRLADDGGLCGWVYAEPDL